MRPENVTLSSVSTEQLLFSIGSLHAFQTHPGTQEDEELFPNQAVFNHLISWEQKDWGNQFL